MAQELGGAQSPRTLNRTLLPHLPLVGRDELNLAEFPFANLQFQRNRETKTLVFADSITGKDGKPVERNWTVTGSDAYGLPVASDVDIVVALLALTHEQGMKTREVYFTRYDLLRIMGWGLKGRNYGRVKEGLDRLTGTTIKAEHAFYDKQKQAYLTRSFHIIDDYDLWDRAEAATPGDVGLPLKSVISWNRHVFRSLKAGYVKRLDTERFFRLKTPIAKQLFRYLDKKFFRDRHFQIDVFKLSHEHLGLSRACRHVSKLKERLAPALSELVQDGYLESFAYVPSQSNRRSLTVRFVKAAKSDSSSTSPAAYFYQQLQQRTDAGRPISGRENELAGNFVEQHGLDTFREFTDFVMREKTSKWPGLATLTGAFMAFEQPFIERFKDREFRQQQVRKDQREQAAGRAELQEYDAYLRPCVERAKQSRPEEFAQFQRELHETTDYQQHLAALRKLDSSRGPLSKAARDAAELDLGKVFNREFARRFEDGNTLSFESWRERNRASSSSVSDSEA